MEKEKKLIEKIIFFKNQYGTKKLLLIIAKRAPIKIDLLIKQYTGIELLDFYRRLKNNLLGLIKYKEPKIKFIKDDKYNLIFPDKKSYKEELKYHLRKKQCFHEYLQNNKNKQKKYIDIKIGAYFQCFNQKKATFETLKSFRKYYPDAPVYLLSDKGEDFSEIARHFNCDYEYSEENIAYWPCKNIIGWLARINKVCEKFSDCDWILLLEDDVRVRDKISKMPRGHLVGQGGGDNLKGGKQISLKAKEYIWDRYPGLEINGISGCGGSIFHRKSFIDCYKNIEEYDVETLKKLDNGLSWATDFALTFLFLMNGLLVRRWLDHSDEPAKNYGPASAFDHYFKIYYQQSLTEEDLKIIKNNKAI